MKCVNCGHEVKNQYFCPICGEYLAGDKFKNREYIEETQMKLKALIENTNNQEHNEILWNDTVDNYVKTIEKLRYVTEQSKSETSGKGADVLVKSMDNFIERCRTNEFQIAFVGTIKAGKSTLINAILGKNLASTSVTPETAVLTKFRHSEENEYIKVKFYSEYEWTELWQSISNNADVFKNEYAALEGEKHKNEWIGHSDEYITVADGDIEGEIERWTSSKKVEHYFVKEVEVGMKNLLLPNEVVLVDTPGLDDAVKYRSDVTRSYIDRANAVFACVKSDSLTGNELSTIIRIFSNTSSKEKIYIIGTQWDTLNNPEEDWKKQKAEWVKYLSSESTYCTKELAEKNIIHAAAYIENLCRDYENLSKDKKKGIMTFAIKVDIEPSEIAENIPKLRELSNIENVNIKIKHEILEKYQKYLLDDISKSYIEIKSEIKKYFSEIKNDDMEIIETSQQSVSEINAKYEQAKEELQKVKEYKDNLSQILQIVRDDTNARVEALCSQLRNMI